MIRRHNIDPMSTVAICCQRHYGSRNMFSNRRIFSAYAGFGTNYFDNKLKFESRRYYFWLGCVRLVFIFRFYLVRSCILNHLHRAFVGCREKRWVGRCSWRGQRRGRVPCPRGRSGPSGRPWVRWTRVGSGHESSQRRGNLAISS